ncbi:MAG TPA: M20/M25/M40 family metallo-hydrolase [Candidatus Acidoferrales bacterium]|nr:M20/M25/M40 family metallo-hydrolase [Candidatus Acidoferrales bacterium]
MLAVDRLRYIRNVIQNSAAKISATIRLILALGIFAAAFHSSCPVLQAQERPAAVENLNGLLTIPAVPGYEARLAQKLRSELQPFHPSTDNLGDVLVTIGAGSPNRLIVAPMDEPGYVVSDITDDGYLRLQRLPRNGLPPVFNDLYSAQAVRVGTFSGDWVNGVVAGLSIHLQPARLNPPKADDLDNLYVDIGASSAADVRKSGIDLLSPVAIDRQPEDLAYGKLAGASVGDKFGAAALIDVLRRIDASQIKGTVTFAFVAQQWVGARGLQRILTNIHADEMIYVGRLVPGGPVPGLEGVHRAPRREPGSGVLLGLEETNGIPLGFATDLKQIADANKIPFVTDYSAAILPRSYSPPPPFPQKWVHLGIATDWQDTPAEVIDAGDLAHLEDLLMLYSQQGGTLRSDGQTRSPVAPAKAPARKPYSNIDLLERLIPLYGASNHEDPVRAEIKNLLPDWAKTETDDAGNLILRAGAANSKSSSVLFVAHMDEIGFEVKTIADDGRLEVAPLGGMELSYYLGHPALVHTSNRNLPAVMELPNGWDEPTFHWPSWTATPEKAIRVDVGARSRQDAEKLGIKVGDTVTIPKAYRALSGSRANGRSFDDRVGCTALISALWALGGSLKDRDVTFVWSTGEELGLNGAAALAARLSKEGHAPAYVFAIDTFVSSDSPLESKRFADAQIGKGFVVRAVDDSNITPRDLVDRVVKLARSNQVPVQYGVTGGGNDGSAFLQYGSIDIPLSWPLRYSHSPGEVIDTRDVDALSRIITLLAKTWSN